MGIQKQQANRKQLKNTQPKDMALHINTFSPFSMRSALDGSLFKNAWEDGWMMPNRSQVLQNPFKEFKSTFNEEETKVNEDDAKMEVRIDASEYKPEELKVSVQSGRLFVEGKHEEKKEDGSAYVQKSFSRSYTLPKEALADQMVSNLSSDGVLVITTPKSALALTNETPKDK